MFNEAILVGRLTKDIELSYAPNGLAVGKVDLAVSRKVKKADGTIAEDVLFMPIVIYGKSAENASNYTKKGSLVLIKGFLKQDRWVDKNGYNRTKINLVAEKIVFLNYCNNNFDNTAEDRKPRTDRLPADKSDIQDEDEIPF